MQDHEQNVYENPVAMSVNGDNSNRVQSTGLQQSCGSLSMKVATIGLILVMVSVGTMIGLHFHQQSEWKKAVDSQAQKYLNIMDDSKGKLQNLEYLTEGKISNLSRALSEARDQIRHIQNKSEDLTAKAQENSEGLATAEDRILELENISQSSVSCIAEGGLYYRHNCFTIPHSSSSSDMDYNQAVAECAKTAALLVEIHDRAQQTVLHAFAFSKLPSGRSYIYLWIGMEYQNATSTLLYRSGKQTASSQFQWDASHPYSNYKYMNIEVGNDGDSSVGLWNTSGGNRNGVICEKRI